MSFRVDILEAKAASDAWVMAEGVSFPGEQWQSSENSNKAIVVTGLLGGFVYAGIEKKENFG